MKATLLIWISLLWSLVEVHSQIEFPEFPYVSFRAVILPNHATKVGNAQISGQHSVECHTDLTSCCVFDRGIHRGDWYSPNGERRPFTGQGPHLTQRYLVQAVFLDRNTNRNNSPSGIYRCDIPTNAVHSNDISVRDTVYVGLYRSTTGGRLC